ncbi:MAG: hypothetical protein AB7N70_15165 [Dehalococcoidia bacterium]
MSFLNRLFGSKNAAVGSPPAQSKHDKDELLSTVDDVECPHVDLGPHWANAADMGQMDKVTGYQCGGCLHIFSPAEVEVLREHEPERLAWMTEGDQTPGTKSSDSPPSGRMPGSEAQARTPDH